MFLHTVPVDGEQIWNSPGWKKPVQITAVDCRLHYHAIKVGKLSSTDEGKKMDEKTVPVTAKWRKM